jgi:hypothetical protein
MKQRALLAMCGFSVAAFAVSAQAPAPGKADTSPAARGVIEDYYGEANRLRPGTPSAQAKAYSPSAGRKSTRVLWGDPHVHSNNSPDAFAGGVRFTPEETFRIARG